jgi:hypothetical protein
MTAPEQWLMTLADPKFQADNLPRQKLKAAEVAPLCVLSEMHGVLPATLQRLDCMLRNKPELLLSAPGLNLEILAALQPMQKRLTERSAIALFLGAESRRIQLELRATGVEAILLKGIDFAGRLYAPPALRSFNDIDVLVRASQWDGVEATLARLGYLPHETPMKYARGYSERTWQHPAMPGAMVEVHDNLVNSPTVRRGVSVRLEDVPTQFASDGLLRATPTGLLIIAAVHGAASHSFDKVQHLCDVAQIVRGRAGPIDEAALRECLEKTGAGFSVALALDLTARTLNEKAAAELLARLKLRWPRRLARLLITPTLVARSQGTSRRAGSWRRQTLRQLLKRRR